MISIVDAFCNMYNVVMERDSEATSLASEMSPTATGNIYKSVKCFNIELILERIFTSSFWKWYPHQNNTKYQTLF